MNRFAMLGAACLLLSACNDDPAPAEPGGESADARGEVLGGTISDDMIPLDTITSQSPSQASAEGEDGDTGGASAPAAGNAGEAGDREAASSEDATADEEATGEETAGE